MFVRSHVVEIVKSLHGRPRSCLSAALARTGCGRGAGFTAQSRSPSHGTGTTRSSAHRLASQ